MQRALACFLSWITGGHPVDLQGVHEVPAGDADFLFAEGAPLDLALDLDAAAIDTLRGDPKADVTGTLVYGGERVGVVVSIKGSSTQRTIDEKPSLRLDFGAATPGGTFHGLRRITLNNMVGDATMLHEHAAYRLYGALGVKAPRHGYARLSISGEDYGLYGIVETLDEDFLARNWPDDAHGNLYDSKYTNADLTGSAVANFELQVDGGVLPAFVDLDALVGGLDASFDGGLERFDSDMLLKMFAADLAMGHYDGYPRNANNYLLYHAASADRWWMVPWGQDNTFAWNGPIHEGYQGRVAVDCLDDAACKTRLDAALLQVADTWEAIDLPGYVAATWSRIQADCESDPRKELDCDPQDILDFVQDIPESIRSQIE